MPSLVPTTYTVRPIAVDAAAVRGRTVGGARPSPSRRQDAGLRHDADVRPWRPPAFGVLLPGVVVGDGAGDDDIVSRLPVCGRRHCVPGGQLHRIEDAQHFVEVAA